MALLRRIGANGGFLALMLLFVASAIGGTTYILQRLRSEAIDDHLEICAMYARVFEDHLTQSINFVSLAMSRSGAAAPGELRRARIEALLAATLQETPALRSLSLVDADGRIVASSNAANVGLQVDASDYLPPASDGRELLRLGRPWSGRDFNDGKRIDAPQGSRDSGPSFIPAQRQFLVGGRRLALLAALNPDYFINNYSQKLASGEGYVEVLRYDGVSLLTTEPQAAVGRQWRTRLLQKQLPEIESGVYIEKLPGQDEELTAFRASARYPLVVVAHVHMQHALAGWVEERRLLLLIVPPALLALLVLASLLYNRQRRLTQQRAEARQREHEKLAATVFATVDAAVVVSDAQDHIVEVNPAFTRISGYTFADVAGRGLRQLIAERHRHEFFKEMDAQLATKGTWHGEIWLRRNNGVDYIAWLSINRIGDEQGRLRQNVASFADITDRKQAEEAQLRAVLEASPDAVILVADDGRIAFANAVAEHFFGYSASQLRGLDVSALVPSEMRAAHHSHRRNFFLQPQPRPMASGLHLEVRRQDGARVPVEISLSPIRMGDRAFVIATVSDIAQRVRDEEALRRAKERAEELLGRARMAERRIVDISEEAREKIGQELHDDLGQDLTGIAFLSEVLHQKLRSAGRTEMQEAAAITELINKAVSKTRTLAQGLYPVELKEAGLQAMLGQVARNVENIYKLPCLLHLDEDCQVKDFLTALNLFRIAQEAISNALKHSGATRIDLRIERALTGLLFSIEDDGVGIGAGDGAADAKMRGLGLHIMHYRAALIGATLQIGSAVPRGTRITIELPD